MNHKGMCALWNRYPRGSSCYYEREIEGVPLAYCKLCVTMCEVPTAQAGSTAARLERDINDIYYEYGVSTLPRRVSYKKAE